MEMIGDCRRSGAENGIKYSSGVRVLGIGMGILHHPSLVLLLALVLV